MAYLVTQMWFCLVLAAILGFFLGWLIRGWFAARRLRQLEDERNRFMEKAYDVEASASSKAVGDDDDFQDEYEVTEIEGIGKGYSGMLGKMGILSTADLLSEGSGPDGRKIIAESLSIEEFVVCKWVSMADLIRIPGIRGQFAELLEASGIESIQHLSEQDAGGLTKLMEEVNEREKRTRVTPTADMVAGWIEEAKKLPEFIY